MMVRALLIACCCSLLTIGANAQQIDFVPAASIGYAPDALVALPLSEYETIQLSVDDFRTQLAEVPDAKTTSLAKSQRTIQLPLPNGTTQAFRVVESSVMQAPLQARWPQLRTYKLLGTDNPLQQGRLAVTPKGISATFSSSEGDVYVEPFSEGDAVNHIVYYNHNFVSNAHFGQQFACGFNPANAAAHSVPTQNDVDQHEHAHETHAGHEKSEDALIREYILALTCTGEYGQQKGGTVESVLASFVTAINLANATFEQEVGVTLTMISNQEALVFTNPGTDPFVNADQGGALLGQVRPAITSQGIPTSLYDLGHVFTSGCTDVGGVVGGAVCTAGKDRGVTCHYTNSISNIINRVFTHEVAHQFAVAHSWANCPGSEGQLASDSAFEPGSGTTIMSYAGSCGGQNISFNNDTYYHGHSLEQFIDYTREGQANLCATELETANSEPKLTLPLSGNFHIPISTPFELIGAATDSDGDEVTYCWEQMDLGPIAPIGEPTGNTPLFRSYPPTTEPNRVFPRLSTIIFNQPSDSEVLPTYSRDLTFRCTVRDNNPEIGATIWEDIAFRSTSTAGPFVVMSPNTGDEIWSVGEYREVTWDVANTTNELVNCQQVDILLSTDGGMTYPHTLIEGTYNDGSAFVNVPDLVGDDLRARVQASNSIFFDISNADFGITPGSTPSYTLAYGTDYRTVCGPEVITIPLTTSSVFGYEEMVNFSVANELPDGVATDFSNPSIAADGTTELTVDLTNLQGFNGLLEVVVNVTAADVAERQVSFYFDITDTDFSGLTLVAPVDGEAGINLGTDFSWEALSNADTYDWELATDAAFTNVVDSEYNLTATELIPNIQFDNSTLYFWRVRASNNCATGDWQRTRVFHTLVTTCSEVAPNDIPITIPGTGPLPTVRSEVFVQTEGQISDINVPGVRVTYQPIQNFYISLTSPDDIEIKLYDQSCFTTDIVAVGFDDEAPDAIDCPPDGDFLYQPVEPLSTFDGENSQGIWTLEVKVLESGFGAPGQLGTWSLEFCADGNAVAPALLDNDTLFVPPGQSNIITPDLLSVTDGEQSAPELTYTIIALPAHGTLFRAGDPIAVGGTFTQETINAGNLSYLNTNPDESFDDFAFVVQDGTGGFLPVDDFNIRMDDNATVNTEDILGQNFAVFPNPTSDQVNIRLAEPVDTDLTVRLLDSRGQIVETSILPDGADQHALDLERLPTGIYLVEIAGRSVRVVKQ